MSSFGRYNGLWVSSIIRGVFKCNYCIVRWCRAVLQITGEWLAVIGIQALTFLMMVALTFITSGTYLLRWFSLSCCLRLVDTGQLCVEFLPPCLFTHSFPFPPDSFPSLFLPFRPSSFPPHAYLLLPHPSLFFPSFTQCFPLSRILQRQACWRCAI